MTYFLKTLCIYCIACLVGLIATRYLLPVLAIGVLGDQMPFRHSVAHAYVFGHYLFIRALMVWGAASLAALCGFFMAGHRPLRLAILTLPVWTPLLYAGIYMGLVAE